MAGDKLPRGRRRGKAGLTSSTSLPPAILPTVVKTHTKDFEVASTDFYNFLLEFVGQRIGPPDEDRERGINFNMNPETNMVEFSVRDTLKGDSQPGGEDAQVDKSLPISPLPHEVQPQ